MPRLRNRRTIRKGKREKICEESKRRRWAIRMLVRSSGGCCAYCGKVCDRREMTIDHAVPLCLGGSDAAENLRLACVECNQAKGAGVALDVYLEYDAAKRKDF